jgi:ATP-dependent helicase HrpB
MEYPVLDILPSLKDALAENRVVVLQAPPGAGKSTIVPLHLLGENWLENKKIIMLEPRRLAARSVAMRMSSLLDQDIGHQVGYRVRFETKISGVTRIEVVTEGILTRMIQQDNTLEDVGLIIFDEFHERSLQADLALALCVQLQQVLRDDLRILIMSATLDGQAISARLGNAPVLTSSGKQYPVDIRYLNPDKDVHLSVQMAQAIQKALREEKGDLLCFLPGAGEINRTRETLETSGVSATIHTLFGDLPFTKQQEAILPDKTGRRKIVLATAIAETSLTIEGIQIVIDSGFSRVPSFDPRSGLTRLETVRVTRDSADQRAGRAGRLGPGICYRLWNQAQHHNLKDHRNPEILEADLAPLVLELKKWGVSESNELTWITPPPPGAVRQAIELLQQLDALDVDERITNRGKQMVQLPTHPRIAHMFLETKEEKALLSLATDLAALLEERDPLPKEISADINLRLSVLRKWRSGERVWGDTKVLDRIERLAKSWRNEFRISSDNTSVNDYDVGRLIALVYPERIARQLSKHSERYKLANARMVKLPEHDPLLREPWLALAHLDAGTKEGRIYSAAPLRESDLIVLAHDTEIVRWNNEREAVEGVVEKRIGNLVLETRPLQKIPDSKRITLLLAFIRSKGLNVLGWEDRHETWQARVTCLKAWRPDDLWPDVSNETLLATLGNWLTPYLLTATKRSDLERLTLDSILSALLPWELQRKLDMFAPERIEVPSGSMITVNYFTDGRAPVMEVRLQELFGLLQTPAINEGKVKILMHLLSPGYKPVQVTQDLKSFWSGAYHDVKKELKRRYPKHSWPDDPFTAQAVRGAKRRNQ